MVLVLLTDGIFDLGYLLALVLWWIVAWVLLWLPNIILYICVPAAFVSWFLSIDAIVPKIYQLLWVHGFETVSRAWSQSITYLINLVWQRCVHAGSCTCFDKGANILPEATTSAVADSSVNTELRKALADLATIRQELATEKQNKSSLNSTSNRWRQRANAAEERVTFYYKNYSDIEEYRKTNATFRNRVEELEEENARLETRCDQERRGKNRHPLDADTSAGKTRNLEILALQTDLEAANKNIMEFHMSQTADRERTGRRDVRITHLLQDVHWLKEEIAELNEAHTSPPSRDDDAKLGLRNEISSLKIDLRIAARELQKERSGGSRDAEAASNADCTRCAVLRKEAVEAEATINQLSAESQKVNNTDINDEENLGAVIVLLREADEELDQLRQLQNVGNAPPDTGEEDSLHKKATEELKTIYNSFRDTLILIDQFEPGQRVGVDHILHLISGIPDFYKLYTLSEIQMSGKEDDHETTAKVTSSSNEEAIKDLKNIYAAFKTTMLSLNKFHPQTRDVVMQDVIQLINITASFFTHETDLFARLTAGRSQIANLENTIEKYDTAARKARERLEPEAVSEEGYTAEEFVAQAVTAVEILKTKIEQQMLFNQSTPNEQHALLNSLQAEIAELKVQILVAGLPSKKNVQETERPRLVIETEMIQSRTAEHKRRFAVYNKLEAILYETGNFIHKFDTAFPLFKIPICIASLYERQYRDANSLPTDEELEELVKKINMLVEWMRGLAMPGSWLEWEESDTDIDGDKYRKSDEVGRSLKPLMQKIKLALEEVDLLAREIAAVDIPQQQKPAESSPQSEGCTCAPQRAGTFTVPGSPCPFHETSSPSSPELTSPLRNSYSNSPTSPRPPWRIRSPNEAIDQFKNGFDPAANTELPAAAARYLSSQNRSMPSEWAHLS